MRCGLVLLASVVLSRTADARGEDFAIELKVATGEANQMAHESKAAAERAKARPQLEAKAGAPLRATWQLRCSRAAEPITDVTVHFFVVREAKVGQRALPKLDFTVAAESALTMDFQTGDRAEGDLSFRLEQPGAYLVRLEALDSKGEPLAFAALDVVAR